MSLMCPRCSGPVSVDYARDFRKRYGLAPGLKDRDTVVVRGRCPRHGSFKHRLNAFNKEAWMDSLIEALYRCMKCEQLGAITNIKEKGQWYLFQIDCPVHGLTGTKRVISSLYLLATQLQEQGISYQKYAESQPPCSYTVCQHCGHVISPGNRFCGKCGMAL